MENKRYIDKVLDYIVSRTKIDEIRGEIKFPFTTQTTHQIHPVYLDFERRDFTLPFVKYCNGQFGLTEEEIEYVWKEYVEIIEDKIEPIMITSHKGLYQKYWHK